MLEDKSIQVVGQAVAGAVSNAEYSLEVGQVYGLLAAFKGDFDDDFVIGTADLSVFVNVVLGVDADPLRAREADMNGDGAVNSNDIQPFVSAMLATN
ncbi:MAG TPA: dockerin type I domain-containing protein [Phycisphaerae bacterium]|nr:dockerin type I domain-containing protein [Phycisphaerae bacterium]